MTGAKHEDICQLVKNQATGGDKVGMRSLSSLPGCQNGLYLNPSAHAPTQKAAEGKDSSTCPPSAWPPPVPTPLASH